MSAKHPTVTGMPHGFVALDGERVEMEFALSDGSKQTLRFSPTTMSVFCARVFEMMARQKTETEAPSGMTIAPIQAETTFAQEAAGGAAVILGLRLNTGFPVHFAVSVEEGAELHRQLGKAVKKAKRQASDSRH